MRLTGVAGLPTFSRAWPIINICSSMAARVKDRLLIGAVRGAYHDLLMRDRHPVVALFLDIPNEEIDVNVHPAKTEVRFREAALVRGLIVGALRTALDAAGHRSAQRASVGALGNWQVEPLNSLPSREGGVGAGDAHPRMVFARVRLRLPLRAGGRTVVGRSARLPRRTFRPGRGCLVADPGSPAGVARGQVAATYIVAETADGLILVDQHAAHERLVLERMRRALADGGVARQALLLPEVVELDEPACDRLEARAGELTALGLELERFGRQAMLVRATPALLGPAEVHGLVTDLADELAAYDETLSLKEKLDAVAGTMACHGSVRAGRLLSVAEMNPCCARWR